jgi:hypothetical protein
MRQAKILIVVLVMAFAPLVAAEDIVKDTSTSIDGEFIRGGRMTTSFNYTLTEIQRETAVDTVLVIDRSGSMSGDKIRGAKRAARQYVNDMLTEAGDRAAVVVYDHEGDEEIIHDLSSDKSSLRQAINSISAGGRTCIDCGIDLSADLSWSDSAVNAMVVLTDGKDNQGGDPVVAADEARQNFVETIHGIIYGNGARTTTMSGISNAGCSKDRSENHDDDSCWFAPRGDVLKDIYQSIREDVSLKASAIKIHAVLPDHATPSPEAQNKIIDSYTHSSGNQTYVFRGPSTIGAHPVSIDWKPGQSGQKIMIMTGESFVEYKDKGQTKTKHLNGELRYARIGYVDYEAYDGSISKDQNGVDISVNVRNNGNHEAPETPLTVYRNDQTDSDAVNVTVAPLQPDESRTITLNDVSAEKDIFTSTEFVTALIDSFGVFQNGNIDEQNEDNNDVVLGRIDVTPPTTTDDYTGSGWEDSYIPVNITCDDDHDGKTTGCAFIEWQIWKGSTLVHEGIEPGDETTVNVGLRENGDLTLRYRGYDMNYNYDDWASATATQVKVDKEDPVPHIISPSDDKWYENDLEIKVIDRESGSGLVNDSCAYRYKNGTQPWSSWTERNCPHGNFTIRVPEMCSANGRDQCKVEARVSNEAGRTGTYRADYNIDTKAPTVACPNCMPRNVRTNTKINIAPDVNDSGTGAVSVNICREEACANILCGFDATKGDSCSFTTSGRPALDQTYWIKATDGLGHTTRIPGDNYAVKAGYNEPCNGDPECMSGTCGENGLCDANLIPPKIDFFPD